ncbi:MAG: heme-binding domain-containing protein [Flavobacteriaceae bacterium]|nr:heme-binding domain-containing protein [Flavobacteriaceae bacterium]
MKFLKKVLFVLFIVFVIAQFFRPEKNQGDLATLDTFLNETNPPEDLHLILKTACFDCHSDYTRYPWYNSITPLNYWLADHIDHGKGELNFSNWAEYSLKHKDHKLEEVMDLVKKKEMPLESYTWTHKDAILSDEQIENVMAWTKEARMKLSNQ